ncbi:MAG: leucyl/phenylalanyl-tRNA--protein transferase [Flavobacteriaceae bacterium]|nr:leucyl/phenylalanyl-tRNA--protein transferase [Flavobacteriaceae bacterium]
MNYLSHSIWFPKPEEADQYGLLAVGGDLSVKRLMHAYRSGIFPWFEEDQPILWWSPNPRMVLFPENFKVSKSLQKTIAKNKYQVTFNTNFSEVIKNCSQINRKGQQGTWITENMKDAYSLLHKLGFVVSVEVWFKNELVGGLYGIDLPDKKVFCGESMFNKMSDASKVGFYYLIEKLKTKGYHLIDCQMYTAHLESLGAEEITREVFLTHLKCK